MSASLARRLAEAADGYRDGVAHFFVFRYNRVDDRFDKEFGSEDAAEDYRKTLDAPDDFGVFGPFETSVVATRLVPLTNIALTFTGGNDAVDPSVFDSLFWTSSSIDKFLMPYYTHVWGAWEAAKLRDRLLSYRWVGHPPGSYPTGQPAQGFFDAGTILIGSTQNGAREEILLREGGLSFRVLSR
jgi:hypothetical protein